MMDLYARLGVARGADDAAIKKAYRSLAKQLHPDRNKDNPKAADRFAEVTAAYDLLSDKDKRAQYDRGEIDEQGNPKFAGFSGFGGQPGGGGGFRQRGPGGMEFEFGGANGAEGADFGDIFEGLFGGGRRGGGPASGGGFGGFGRRGPPQKGANIGYRLSVPFEDAATLKAQRITLGDGKTIDMKIPAGVENGQQVRLAGKGEPGPAGAGDAIVTIEIAPHRFFTREGDDIRLTLPITLDEAVNGGPVKVPTVDGAVMLTVPKGASSGKVLRLTGKGFTRKEGGRGNQLVTLSVDLPADDADLQRFVASWPGKGRNPRAAMGV